MHTQQRVCAHVCVRGQTVGALLLSTNGSWGLNSGLRLGIRCFTCGSISPAHTCFLYQAARPSTLKTKAAGVGGASTTQKLEIGSAPKFETCERLLKKLFRQALQLSTAYKQGSFFFCLDKSSHFSVSAELFCI